jgi:hypothetical protein
MPGEASFEENGAVLDNDDNRSCDAPPFDLCTDERRQRAFDITCRGGGRRSLRLGLKGCWKKQCPCQQGNDERLSQRHRATGRRAAGKVLPARGKRTAPCRGAGGNRILGSSKFGYSLRVRDLGQYLRLMFAGAGLSRLCVAAAGLVIFAYGRFL